LKRRRDTESDGSEERAEPPKKRRTDNQEVAAPPAVGGLFRSLPIKMVDLTNEYARINMLDAGSCGGGTGGFNSGVFVVQRRSDGLVCAEKRMRASEVHKQRHHQEIRLLQRLRHPHIVGFVDAFELSGPRHDPPTASLYMQYFSLGSLSKFVVRQFNVCPRHPRAVAFPEAFVWLVLRSLLSALTYLQTGSVHAREVRPVAGWQPILHRDIKGENVVVRPGMHSPSTSPALAATMPPAGIAAVSRARQRGGTPPADDYSASLPYPIVALSDFGSAVPAPPRSHAYMARIGTTRAYRAPPEVPDQDIEGRTDVWFVGFVAKLVARLKPDYRDEWFNDDEPAEGYSGRLNTAISQALTPSVRRRPRATVMFRRANSMYEQARVEWKPIKTTCPECERERPLFPEDLEDDDF
jgi:serine/threonine protein kinase